VKNSLKHVQQHLLQRHLLVDLFRIGFGKAMKLKWKADRWHQKSWFKKKNTGLPFWDEAWLGIAGRFVNPNTRSTMLHPVPLSKYRNFHTLDEIDSTERNLDRILAMDRVLHAMDPLFGAPYPPTGLLTYKNLLLTLWAGSALRLPANLLQKPSSVGTVPLGPLQKIF
jgi:hypothetical protein